MHSLHGNTGTSDETMVHLRVCNIAGLQKPGRSEFLTEHTVDFLALSETHANAYTQKSFARELREHAVLFGDPVHNRGFAGVAFLYKKSSAWAVKEVPFLSSKCQQFYNDARLLCVQIFRSNQQRSLVVYVVYGKSGARWEPPKKECNKQMLKAILEDSVLRGDVATVFCGDINLTVEDAPDVFDSFQKSRWVDTAWFGVEGFDGRPTSLKGNGARIDLSFVNQTASCLIQKYQLLDGVNPDDHRILDITLRFPLACQHWYMTKRIGHREEYSKPPHDYVPPHITTDEQIRKYLTEMRIDDAYM